MPFTREQLAQKRDTKIRVAMSERAPIWLTNEAYRPHSDALLFDLVYANPVYGWVSQRFKYDGFNDVLYQMGEHRLSEAEALSVQDQEPYITGEIATFVLNEPGNRPSPASPLSRI
ncbi:MAG TPA: hypothetical protein VKQ72_02640 [Aggregatilineales bacterium]|nr:hypothetical protein [Aggregatilineales bacterium]